MNTNDLTPSRLEAARFSAKKFVDSLPFGAEVAVIEFSGQSKVLQELDASKFKAKMAIDLVELREDFGTDIDNVLYDANIIFEGREKKSIILLSDGQINIGNLERSIKYAKERNFVVNTIAVGTSVGGLTDAGSVSRVDEDNLQKISTETGGQFFRIDDLDSLDRSFKDVLEQKERDVVINISSYLLIAALALFSFNWLIHNFRFKTIP
jgi:Ca-activated chloride channel family protein